MKMHQGNFLSAAQTVSTILMEEVRLLDNRLRSTMAMQLKKPHLNKISNHKVVPLLLSEDKIRMPRKGRLKSRTQSSILTNQSQATQLRSLRIHRSSSITLKLSKLAKLDQINKCRLTSFTLIIIRSSCRKESKARRLSCFKRKQITRILRTYPGRAMQGLWTATKKFRKWRLISTSPNVITNRIQVPISLNHRPII
jgi:hypothetical protein